MRVNIFALALPLLQQTTASPFASLSQTSVEKRATGSVAHAEHKRGLFGLALKWTGNFWNGLDIGFGAFGIVHSIIDVGKDCSAGLTSDCVFSAFDLAADIFTTEFSIASAVDPENARREVSDLPVYAHHILPSGNTVAVHIPMLNKTSLSVAAANHYSASDNNTWLHFATAYHPTGRVRKLTYRLATPEDLGGPNDGSVQHIRISPAQNKASSSLSQRDQVISDDGVVLDYIWEDGNEEVWNAVRQVSPNTIGSETAEYWEQDGIIAGCWNFAVQDSNSDVQYANVGLGGLGWNSEEYRWNGVAQSWLDDCAP